MAFLPAPSRTCRTLLALIGLAGCQGRLPDDTSPTSPASSAPVTPADWMAEIMVRTDAAQRTFRPDEDGFAARNDALDYDIRVGSEGLRVHHQGDDIGLTFTAWGRDGASRGVAQAAPELGDCSTSGDLLPEGDCVRQVTLDRGDGATEWVDASARGPEQGWTLSERPDGAGPVVVDVVVEGAVVALDGDMVGLTGGSGQIYRYHDLGAWDANGDALDAWFEVEGDTIRIVVDDAGAVWPIEIDPAMDSTADLTFTGAATSGFLGISVASAGDVNNDGYDDVIVGSSGETSSRGAARVYFGGASMDATADVTITGAAASGLMGRCVASAGDLNGDGYDDVVVGAPGESNMGVARVYYGGSAMDATSDLSIVGVAAGGQLGRSAAAAGDVNADGHPDLIVGSYGENGSNGAARIYFGGTSMDATADVTILGTATAAQMGRSVATAGDLNGDGVDDVVVGSYFEDSGNGAARVYFGGSSMDNVADLLIPGTAVGGRLGYSVAGAGDMNADGNADLIIGCYTENSNSGAARVYFGGSSLDATADVVIQGAASGGFLGESVARAGDLNGDGADDVVIGSYNESLGAGAARVYNGGRTLDNVADLVILGGAASGLLGYSVAGAGDVNGDGIRDIIVGAYNESSGLGTTRIYLGSDDDQDNDSFLGATDCDDTNPAVGQATVRFVDADGDGYGSATTRTVCPAVPGYSSVSGDCDDGNASIKPGAAEVCDGVDNNCDGSTDEGVTLTGYVDGDDDGFGDPANPATVCTLPTGYVADGTDCDDLDDQVFPGQVEFCDEVDNDCDGTVDGSNAVDISVWYQDLDGDYYGDPGVTVLSCSLPLDATADSSDCDDGDDTINPGGTEACDGVDNDCDGAIDESGASGETPSYLDVDGDGFGDPTTTLLSCDLPPERTSDGTDCDDSMSDTYPGAPERCDGERNDCDLASWTPAHEDGQVWLQNDADVWSSQTAAFAAGRDGAPAVLTLPANGTLHVCDGTYFVSLTASSAGTLSVEGTPGSAIFSAGGVGSVLRVTGASSHLGLTGITLEDGAGSGTPRRGGALRVSAGTVTLDQCVVQDSTATSGGGLAVLGGTVTVTNSDVSYNSATSSATNSGGGGWYQSGGTLTMTDTDVTYNTSLRDGGGGYLSAGTFSGTRGETSSNTADANGGGLRMTGAATLTDVSVSYNTATTGSGGGVYHVNSTLVMNSPVIQGNVAAGSGGGVYQAAGSLTCVGTALDGSGFYSNAAGLGGGIYLLSTSTFRSTLCGFGDTTPTNNTPTDVQDGTRTYNYGNLVTFYCSGGTCR